MDDEIRTVDEDPNPSDSSADDNPQINAGAQTLPVESASDNGDVGKSKKGPGAVAMIYQRIIPALNRIFLPAFKIWVAGEGIDDAIRETGKLNNMHPDATTIINYLGEHYMEEWKVDRTAKEYLTALERIDKSGVRATMSLKPSQMGFDVPGRGEELAERNMTAIIEQAQALGIFVWVDMEHTSYTDFTLNTCIEWLKRFDNAGIVLQANLRRTMADLRAIIALDRSIYPIPPKIRLCKGIYKEPEAVAFVRKPEINENFGALISELIINSPPDVWVAVGSHDDVYVNQSIRERGQLALQLPPRDRVESPDRNRDQIAPERSV